MSTNTNALIVGYVEFKFDDDPNPLLAFIDNLPKTYEYVALATVGPQSYLLVYGTPAADYDAGRKTIAADIAELERLVGSELKPSANRVLRRQVRWQGRRAVQDR